MINAYLTAAYWIGLAVICVGAATASAPVYLGASLFTIAAYIVACHRRHQTER